MRRDDELLIDLLLDELSGEERRDVERRLVAESALAERHQAYSDALSILREAAAEGWEARRDAFRWLRPAIAVAAVLLVALTVFLLGDRANGARTVFEPDTAFGYLRAEETDSAGRVPDPSTVSEPTIASGELKVAALGSAQSPYTVGAGDVIRSDSELETETDASVRVDLPHGGILFLRPATVVQIRRRTDGETALRLKQGVACTVVGTRPIHLAVDGTDLLLRQDKGASFVRFSPPEAVCLRGKLTLRTSDEATFDVPEGERLPAACTNDPRTVPVADEELGLDWYRDLVYSYHRVERVEWEKPGRSRALWVSPETMLYVRLVPRRGGEVELRFGDAAKARRYEARTGVNLELRLRLADLGPGPRLEIEPADAVREARLFEATPRR